MRSTKATSVLCQPPCPGNVTQSSGEIFESLDGDHLVGAGDVQQLLHRQPASRAGVLVEAGLKDWQVGYLL